MASREKLMIEENHICCGYKVNYMRGTSCGRGFPCNKTAKYNRDGKWYCGIHDPEMNEQRKIKREQKAAEKELSKLKTWGFKVGLRIYDVKAQYEKEAWSLLFGKIIEVENLGEMK